MSLLDAPRGGLLHTWYVEVGKQRIDQVLAGIALVLLAPVLLGLVLAVRLTSPGPALFRQERLGRGRVPFTVLKLRTMRVDNDDAVHREFVTRMLTEPGENRDGGGMFKLENDPRVTPLGRWLRRTSLDELPQLINVLRGEMALVGPRPCLPWEAELFTDAHQARFDVAPGITGLWQVSGRSRLSMTEALDLDVEYAARQGVLLDLGILARTVPSLLRREAT